MTELNGKSPREAFTASVVAGWKRTDADPIALLTVFATSEPRTISQGGFFFKKREYRAAQFLMLLPGTKVTIRVPIVGDGSRIAVLDGEGRFLCIAEMSPLSGYRDPKGAEDRGRRIGAQNKAIAAMAAEVEEIDLVEEMREVAALHPAAPSPESGGTIRLSGDANAIAEATRKLPANRAQERNDQLDARRAANAATQRYAELVAARVG